MTDYYSTAFHRDFHLFIEGGHLSVFAVGLIVICLLGSFIFEIRRQSGWSRGAFLLGWIGVGILLLMVCLYHFPHYVPDGMVLPPQTKEQNDYWWIRAMQHLLQDSFRFFAGLSLAIFLSLPRCVLREVIRQPKGEKFFGLALSLSLVAAIVIVEVARFCCWAKIYP